MRGYIRWRVCSGGVRHTAWAVVSAPCGSVQGRWWIICEGYGGYPVCLPALSSDRSCGAFGVFLLVVPVVSLCVFRTVPLLFFDAGSRWASYLAVAGLTTLPACTPYAAVSRPGGHMLSVRGGVTLNR